MVLFPCFREFSGAVEFIVFCFFKSGSAMILVLFFKVGICWVLYELCFKL